VETEKIVRTIGEILIAERAKKGLSLDEVQAATRIQKKFLKDLERNNFSLLPSKVVAKGFLKIYAKYLGLSSEPLIKELDEMKIKNSNVKAKITQAVAGGNSSLTSVQNSKYLMFGSIFVAVCLVILTIIIYVNH